MTTARRTLLIACLLCLYGCSVDLSQPASPTSTEQNTPGSAIPATPINTAAPESDPTPLPAGPTTSLLNTRIPITWADLKLTGKIMFSNANVQGANPIQQIQTLDLVTGEISTLFQTTGLAWIYYMTVSPVNEKIVLSYAPPPGYNSPGQQGLYSIPLDGSLPPQLLITPPTADDEYLQAEWSPDGKYLYYVHSNDKPLTAGQLYPIYEIFRMAYPNGQPEKIAEDAFWPRVSADSSQLVYISSSLQDGKNKIFLADADGSNPHQVILTGQAIPEIIDAPIFSPDGKNLLFSAPSPTSAYQPTWLEKLMGIQVVEAHSVPSDWWSVPLNGGTPKQLTHIQSPVLFASVSPNGEFIASFSGNGLFVMKPDGTTLTIIIPDLGGIAGMVSWLP